MVEFSEWLQNRDYSENTIQTYLIYHKLFLKNLTENAQITQETVEKFCSQHAYNSVVKSFLKCYLIDCLKLTGIEIPKRKGRRHQILPKRLDRLDIDRLASATTNIFKVAIYLSFEGGLRVSELLTLKPENIDFDRNEVKLTGKGKKDAIVNFSDSTKQLIIAFIENNNIKPDEKLFTFNRKQFYDKILRLSLKVLGKSVTPHWFRHACGFHLRKSGADLRLIQEYLRHSRLDTVRIYTAVDDKEKSDAWKRAFG